MIDAAIEYLGRLEAWQATVLVLALSLAGAVAFEVVGVRVARRLVRRTESRFDDVLFAELRLPVVTTVFLAGVYLLTRTPTVATGVLGAEQLDRFFGKPSLTIVVLVWGWALNRLVNRWVAELQNGDRHYDFAPVFSNVWTLGMVAASSVLILRLWRIDVTPLIGAAGIAGIAVGFAAKDTVANFFGGLALYFDDTYKLGDFVVLESGEAGTVVKVGVRSTTLLTRSEVLVTVPNAMLNAGKVINQSAPQRRKRIKVPVGVAYGTDVDAFEELLLGAAADEDLVLDEPVPRARFRSFGPSALEYELLCWVGTPAGEGKARHRLNRAIYAALDAAGMEIPYPRRDLVLREGAPVPGAGSANGAAEGADEGAEPTPRDDAGPG